jgi:peptidoglycan/LPS O-acetylase OafA/YrhL
MTHGDAPYNGPERRSGTPSTGLDRGRSSGLDGLRAFASLLVVAFHLRTVLGVSFGPLDPVVGGGDIGVYIFFALSGYLLYKPFVRGSVDLGSYALKRAGRIFPGYYLALAGLVVLTGSRLPIDHPLPYLGMAASYDIPLRGFLGNAWTLSAEVLFYATLPLIARLAHGRETAVLGALGLASAVAGTIHLLTLSPSTEWLFGTYPFVFYAFVPGMLLAVLEVRRPGVFAQLAAARYLIVGVVYLILAALTHQLPVALGAAIGTPMVMAWLIQHRLPWPRALTFAGGASYALYLWHKDLFIAFGVAGLPVALLASGLSWARVERPILAKVHSLTAGWSARRPIDRPVPVAIP